MLDHQPPLGVPDLAHYSGMESAYNGASRHLQLVPHDVPKHVIVHYYARESRYIYPFSLRRVGFIKRVL